MQKIKPANILVCHSGDLFGDWIPTEWIIKIFDTCKNAPWHNYMFLTMNPKRYFELMESGLLVQQDNFWYGTRVTQNIQAFTADGYHTFLYIDSIGRFVERYVLPSAEWMLLGSGTIIKRKWIDSIMDHKEKIPYNPRIFRSLSPSANAIHSHIFKAEVMEICRRENLY